MIRRGELYYADLNPVVGSEQGGVRPILVLQNDVGNKYSPTIIAAATTSRLTKAKLPTHIELTKEHSPLAKNSIVLLEQIRTIDKSRIKEKIGELSPEIMQQIDNALLINSASKSFFSSVERACGFIEPFSSIAFARYCSILLACSFLPIF